MSDDSGAQNGSIPDDGVHPTPSQAYVLPGPMDLDEPLSQADCDELMAAHAAWLQGAASRDPHALGTMRWEGKERKNFTGRDLRGKDLSRANLRSAKFVNAELAGARFIDADLTNADFTGARELLPDSLAGALLTNAKPATMVADSGLKTVEDMSRNSGKNFAAVMAACVYVIITVATSSDVGLVTDSNTAMLPIINMPINTISFFLLSPVVLFVAYIYLHLDLQRLWDTLASLPAVFPDGRTLDEQAYPWFPASLHGGIQFACPIRGSVWSTANLCGGCGTRSRCCWRGTLCPRPWWRSGWATFIATTGVVRSGTFC